MMYKQNCGLIDSLIVRDGDFTVLEGNNRLAAYRLLCRTDAVTWGKVKCKLLPADIDEIAEKLQQIEDGQLLVKIQYGKDGMEEEIEKMFK